MFGAIVAALVAGSAGLGPRNAAAPQPTESEAEHVGQHDHGDSRADTGPSSVVNVASEEQFATEVLADKGLWLVDFHATWCGACRVLGPVIEAVARENETRFRVAKIDVDKLPGLAGRYKVGGVPQLNIIVGGKEVSKKVGALDGETLLRWVESKLPAPAAPEAR